MKIPKGLVKSVWLTAVPAGDVAAIWLHCYQGRWLMTTQAVDPYCYANPLTTFVGASTEAGAVAFATRFVDRFLSIGSERFEWVKCLRIDLGSARTRTVQRKISYGLGYDFLAGHGVDLAGVCRG